MATIIRQRRDTAANWVTNDSVIPDGQICVDTTNKTLKIGDGSTLYSALEYMNSDLAGVTDTTAARANLGVDSSAEVSNKIAGRVVGLSIVFGS